MRKLTKGTEPQVLVENKEAWTAKYKASAEPRPPVWRDTELVNALRDETHGKCAYCEGVVDDVTYAQVEHILPKSVFPDLVVDWDNLTIACQKCNTEKRNYYNADIPLLNPYVDSPVEHLLYIGPIIRWKIDDVRGRRSVERLKLQRVPLFLERAKRIDVISRLIQLWEVSEGEDKETAAIIVIDALADECEFAQTLREYARAVGFPVDQLAA